MLMGNLVYTLSQWGIIMVLAKLGSPAIVGGFTLGLAVTAPITLIFDLQLRSVLATDVKNEFSFRQYLTLKVISSLIALIVLGSVIILGGYNGQAAMVIFILGVAKIIESVIELHYGLYQKFERMDMIAQSLIIRGISSLFIIAILITMTNSLVIAVLGFALTWIMLFFIIEVPKVKQMAKIELSSTINQPIRKLLFTSLPLGIVMMMISLYTNIPRYVIEHTIGMEAVGYFSAIFYIVTAGNLVVNAVGQTISPRLAHFYSNEEYSKFTKLLIKFILLGFSYGILGIILTLIMGKQVLGIVYTKDFVHYHDLFVLLMISGMFMYAGSFLGFALTAMRKFSIQPFLSIIWVISTIILSMIMIPSQGLMGAAYVTIITTAIQQLTLAIAVMWYVFSAKKSRRFLVNLPNH
jgi:O-antigen/teichoic acid export membrane protein